MGLSASSTRNEQMEPQLPEARLKASKQGDLRSGHLRLFKKLTSKLKRPRREKTNGLQDRTRSRWSSMLELVSYRGEGRVEGGSRSRLRTTKTPVGRPPRSSLFESLPFELLQMIISLLDKFEQATLCSVSFFLLIQASEALYRASLVTMSAHQVVVYLKAKIISKLLWPKTRVQAILEPKTLYLESRRVGFEDQHHLTDLEHQPPLPVAHLIINFYTLQELAPLLRMLDPATFQIGHHNYAVEAARLPTIEHVVETTLSFARRWTRLDKVISDGVKSFPVLPGPDRRFGFAECLLKSSTTRRGGRITFKLVSVLRNGSEEEEYIISEEVVSRLTGKRFLDRKRVVLVTSMEG